MANKNTIARCEVILQNCKQMTEICGMLGGGCSIAEVAKHYDMSPMTVLNKLKAAESLDFKAKTHIRNAREKTDDDFLTPEERLYKDVFKCEISELAEIMPDDAIDTIAFVITTMLSEREGKILRLRYEDDMTLEDIAKFFNVTCERVRQIEAKAIRKLRHPERARALQYGLLQAKVAAARFETAKQDRIRALLARQVECDPDVIELAEAGTGEPLTIEELGLSVRSFNCLKRAGVQTLDDICALPEMELRKIRNLGRLSVEEIIACVYRHGRKMQWEE